MKVNDIYKTKIDYKDKKRIDYKQSTCKKWIALITLLLISIQMAWAQGFTDKDLTETEICDFQKGTISYTIPPEKISEDTQCDWTVKVGEEVTKEGVSVSEDKLMLTLNLSQETRSVEVSYTDAESKQPKTISFVVEPKVYGETYNGENNTKVNFYAAQYAGGEGTEDNPYIISTDLQLAKLAHDVNTGNGLQVLSGTYFRLSQDIDLKKGIWMPIGTWNTATQHFFAGKINGDGHAIKNMLIQWTNISGKEASWGLFSRLNGTGNNKAGYASVTNLLIENACIEKKKGYVPVGSSVIKLGILAADMTQNAEIGNIIIRNSKVTDHGEAYKTINNYRVGGVVGYLNNNFSLRIYNISADTEMNMHTQATLNPSASIKGQVTISGGFGAASRLLNAGYAILPRNIYIHGPQMKTNSDTKKCYRGTVMAFIAADNFVSKVNDTWYYTPVNKVSEPNDFNNGSEKEIDAVNQTTNKIFGSTFAEQNNEFIKEMDGMKTWAYSNSNKQFSFNSIKIKYERGTEDKLTVVDEDGTDSSEKYDWYVSKDNATWKKANTTKACNPFILPRQEYDQYVYATVGSSRTNTIQVKAIHVEASLSTNSTNVITYTVNVTNDTEEKFTNEELGLKITYQWYKGENKLSEETKASFTRPEDATHKDKFRCFVTVEISPDYTFSKWVNATTVVYLQPATTLSEDIKKQEEVNIKNAEYGYSANQPMLTWKGAYSKLSDKASWDENVIVLMGKSNTSITNDQTYGFNITPNNIGKQILTGEMWSKAKKSPLFKNVTITGKYNQTEYKNACIEITSLDMGLPIWKDTRFEHVTFNNEGTGDDTYKNIFCQYNNLEMGEGIRMTGFNKNSTNYGTIDGAVTTPMQIFGGFSNDGRFYPLNNKDSIAAFNRSMPHGKEGFCITIKSGFYSAICVGGRQTITKNDKGEQLNGVMGTPTQPIKCTITMDIDRKWNDDNNQKRTIDGAERTNDYDAGIILAGNHEGAMYADVDIIIRSGKVARIVNGTLGAQSEFTLDYGETTYNVPLNTFMGRANILLDPANSEYRNSDGLMDNDRVVVTELYGGSMGRGHTSDVRINNPFYGYSTITINGGTFKILPDNNDKKDNILCGIFGAGAGGMNGIGTAAHHTPDERIAYWNTRQDVMLYGPYDVAKDKLISYTCYNADEHKEAVVNPQDTNTKIIINSGNFGSSDKKIDGIYAGGSGYMSPGLWTNKGIPSKTGGNVYGNTKDAAVSLTINGGTFYCENGIFAGGRGTDRYYSSNPYSGNASDYTALGQTYGNVALNINGGTFHCPIFGGGYGVADAKLNGTNTISTLSDMARIYGKSNVTINGGTFYQDIYGGGDMAVVEYQSKDEDYATNVVISDGADIRGSVFAGGNGRAKRPDNLSYKDNDGYTKTPDSVGLVKGSTNVIFTGSTQKASYIYGDIYGGGSLAQVQGNTNVNIFAANFAGQVFGGGKGNITDKDGKDNITDKDEKDLTFTYANVTGNTYVTLAQDMGGQEEGDDGKKKDSFSINVIWDKIWDTENGFIKWNPKSGENRASFYASNIVDEKEHFLNPHNIYGGGDLACNVEGTAFVEVQKGMTPFDLLQTTEWKESYNDNNYPHFSVFGGGYGEHTTVTVTDVTVNVEGDYGDYNAEVEDETDQMARPHNRAQKKQKTTLPVFDNSKGIPNFTILGVLGGGYAGTVTKNTKVTVDGKTFLHRVYGGGFGDPYNKAVDNTTGQIGDGSESSRSVVLVQGGKIYGDIFGGGAGVAPKTANSTPFTNVARVNGNTMVQISDDAKIYGKVYGGGDMANVGPASYQPDYSSKPLSHTEINPINGEIDNVIPYKTENNRTLVNIIGGDIFGSVYGGGKGLLKEQAEQYDQVGRINGNTIVHIANTDAAHSISLDYEGNTVPYVWHNIYGGCAYGTVDGNTLVHIEGGMLGRDIFGGGYGDDKDDTYANILGNTKVQMDGGTWIWNQKADVDGNITTWTAAQDKSQKICKDLKEFKLIVEDIQHTNMLDSLTNAQAKAAIQRILTDKNTQEFFRFNNSKTLSGSFLKNNNIYGGGNLASYVGFDRNGSSTGTNTGEAIVEINHSPLDDITDKDGKQLSMFDYTTLPGLCWYISAKNVSDPQFSVFGAGYGAKTKVAKTEVYAQPGSKIGDNGIMEVDGKAYRYINQKKDYEAYVAIEKNLYADFKNKVSSEEKKLYYGSSDGSDKDPNTYQRYRASRLAWTLGMPGFSFQTIHGGGFAGYVTGNTYVETDCQLFCENIYGAGLGAVPSGDATNREECDFGSVTGNSKVFVKSGFIARNIYGGGAGIESAETPDSNFIDFPKMAHVNKTEVHLYGRDIKFQATGGVIDRTIVMGCVYGGGDVANVGSAKVTEEKKFEHDNYAIPTEADRTTLVNIRGGSIFSAVFAGGKGRLRNQCRDYQKLGSVKGNSCLVIDRPCMEYPYWDSSKKTYQDPSDDENMQHPEDNINQDILPNLLERVYGGGQNGIVYGNTIVRINDGNIGHGIYGGGLGSCDMITVAEKETESVTSADVTRNTNVLIYGGKALLTSYWKPETRSWEPASIIDGIIYSPQYDHDALKFKINHNIYAGGNIACEVGKDTYLTMAKGLLHENTKVVSGQDDSKFFFESEEWHEIFDKVGSPHFCVFGGGYGEHTVINGNTHLDIEMEGRGSIIDHKLDIKKGEEYKHFLGGYSVMDFVGGGYSGKVVGDTHITGKGGAFCRRLFGGGFYNSVNATHVNIEAMDCQNIFGGGMMGDVIKSTEINIGRNKTALASESSFTNKDIFIHGNIYGGNDVSGYINVNDSKGYFADNGGTGTHINIYGGRIDGDVYGAGNGDYLYALDRKGNTQVTVNENYPLDPNDPNSETTPLVFTVPMRENMPSYKAASDALKMVNINSWRPLTNKVNIHIEGNSESDIILIKGDVYGGGNSATVQKVKDDSSNSGALSGDVNIWIGSNVNIRSVFMGCNGDALFTASEDNNFMNKFQKLNGDYYDASKELNLADTIDWENDPSSNDIDILYLPTEKKERALVYPHLIDLYFQPVEMNIQGKLTWGTDLKNCTIGSFFCGGNRGNMNIYPDKNGKVVDYTFPKGLTITEKIVGGCNNANYDYKGLVTHEGGYLLGTAHSTEPFIKLTIQNKFMPKVADGAYKGGCVYGGCYKTGTVRGDVKINLQTDMLAGKSKTLLDASNTLLATNPDYSSLNVYGAGYGMESYVYGNTRIVMGDGIPCAKPTMDGDQFQASGIKDEGNPEGSGVSANFIYGGGQQGNVIGLTDVDILNGHVYRSVTGGSYSGYVYGSTQVKVGYPTYYKVKALKNGKYILNRTDKKNNSLQNDNGSEKSPTIKQEIHLLAGELITQGVYDDIVAIDNGTQTDIPADKKSDYFTKVDTATPSMGWDNVHINIDEAIYGGGYSLAQGTSVLANNTTVLKLTKDFNVDKAFTNSAEHQEELKTFPDGTTAGFGGNTLILVGDSKKAEHITISRQDMKEIDLPDGTDLYGYYYKYYDDANSNQYTYRFIYEQVKYIKGDVVPPGLTGCRENKFYEYDSEGGIFGDGHLSYAQGFRSADITGYGFAGHTIDNPKIINTLQRMDILRLEDNCFSLLGARDYTVNEINKTPYSVARVGEIKMVATDILLTDGKLQAEQPESTKTSESTQASNVFKYSSKARNYMGLANNIHYVGAVKSNVQFSDKWYNENGEAKTQTYQDFKEACIEKYKEGGMTDVTECQKRNNGTAKNMIGIASGYALKIQNAQESIDPDTKKMKETIYYGPIYGIIEMNLMNARKGEGGGYVYADNIHEVPGENSKGFLETTGNFVFPLNHTNISSNRFIIDDCSPTGFYAMEGKDPDTNAEIHYWYVTGFNYYYNAHITGYTYKEKIHFDNDNSDGLTALAGLKKGQEIYIKSWKMRSGHDESYKCDLEKNAADKYTLYVGASASNTYAGPLDSSDADKSKKGFAAILSMSEKADPNNIDSEDYNRECLNTTLPTDLNGDAKISFRLMDNNTANASTDYYNKHLSKKCQATLVLGAKLLDANGKPMLDDDKKEIEYTYTIFLNIEYVQGPNFTGHITIDNCALPGEMIRLKKDQVKIAADQAFAANGYFWHIGKLKKNEKGEFSKDEKGDMQFDEKESWLLKTKDSKNTYKQGDKIDNSRKDLFAGSVYDKTKDYLDIPAYYFMNGYGVQLGVTMNGFNDVVFPVNMAAGDTLTVHNYQQMDPHKAGVNLHLSEAIQRAKTEPSFAEPRIYINDASDLKAFINFVDTIGTGSGSKAERYGKNAQFVLQNDITMTSNFDESKAVFAGTLHGNGHVIKGLAQGKSFLQENRGNIYNLGMESGSIAASNKGSYHCCFEYAPASAPDKPIVYDMDGNAINTYTKDDFKYGKVAYDLNGYYLRARKGNSTDEDKKAVKYVYDYYANGDYQYAHRTDAITGKNTGITYLRKGQDSDLPNYGQAETRHDKTHTIDQARAQGYQAATKTEKEKRIGNYLPLFNANNSSSELMNDFLFWGQSLQSTPADYPAKIASQQNKYMNNRVYRTDGYYGSKEKDKFHYNAYKQDTRNMGTYVHIPTTTAIDFTAEDADNATSFTDFIVKDGVTQNLLVYTAADDDNSDTDAYNVVNKTLAYNEDTEERSIKGHHIVKETSGDLSTVFFHLVERTPDGKNSEGDDCLSNDLCVPIPFKVTDHAWYVRKPMYYANETTGAWESICLPFTVQKAVASLNGEITHFYGNSNLHHEYWLRGLTAVATTDSKTAATFQRPGDGLFKTENTTSMDYTFHNTFFVDTYGDWLYNNVENPYYGETQTLTDYLPLTAEVPYIVRFPGNRYYEFDLSSEFYNNILSRKEAAQTITFHAFGEKRAGENVKKAIEIPISANMETHVNGFYHRGTFAAKQVANGTIYGMNADGTAFEDDSQLENIMPFRTYMTSISTNARTRSADTPSVIHIAETTGIDKIQPEVNGNGEDTPEGDELIVRPIPEHRVRIESTYATQLKVFSTTGQLYRILDVQPGTAIYSGFHPGFYIFGKTKVMVK